jgi:hypothetical protein
MQKARMADLCFVGQKPHRVTHLFGYIAANSNEKTGEFDGFTYN